jgi:hypothetical protein
LPGQRVAGDEHFDQLQRPATRRGVQRKVSIVPESWINAGGEQLSHAVDVAGANGREQGIRRVGDPASTRDLAHEFGPITKAISTRKPPLRYSERYGLVARQAFCFFAQVFGGGACRKIGHGILSSEAPDVRKRAGKGRGKNA